ncbi:MAG: PLP-dependent cysteine synthase family protein [Bacteroidales bacterium]|nr:PLP-dependent cysteine synthase family protein [Bacteroidales bacterium]
MIASNILDTIGNTPLVKLESFSPSPEVNIYAKLEGTNPSGSIKDRPALRMIECGEASGKLCPGKTIVEASSGNMGISLAMIGAVKGYKVKIFMSEGVSAERRKILAAYGAEVVLTPAAEGTDGAIRRARALAAEDPQAYYMPDQFSNKGNYMSHFVSTAGEILQQTHGRVDYVVSAIGTSGTLMGLAKYLKEASPSIKIVCAQPTKGHYIQGLKNLEEAIVPAIYNPDLIDIQEMIETEDAFAMARRIISQEGIFVGMSSGAAMVAAVRVAQRIPKGNIVVIFPDRGEKYISTSLFSE